ELKEYCNALNKSGRCVGSKIVSCVIRGIVEHHDKSLLEENGGHVNASFCGLIQSFYRRTNRVKRNSSLSKMLSQEEIDKGKLKYTGKTERCHPKIKSPEGWDIYHTETHWSNEKSKIRCIENIMIPYVQKVRQSSNDYEQVALVTFDSHSSNSEAIRKLLHNN